MKIWLEDEQGSRHALAGITSIGRMSGCAVVLNSRHVSRRHAVVYSVAEDRHWLVDLGSTNGVRVNNVRLTEPWPLHDGDRIQIGDRVLNFRSRVEGGWDRRPDNDESGFQSTVVMPNRAATRSYGAMMVEKNGRMVWQSRRAGDWLEAYFPNTNSPKLPGAVQEWLTQKNNAAGSVAVPFAIEKKGRRLVLRAVEENEGRLLVLLTEEEPESGAVLAARFGLTPREREVMHWLVEGKSNPEIASILGLSPRTVEKHLEVVFNKLGVGNRTAALRAVMEATAERTP